MQLGDLFKHRTPENWQGTYNEYYSYVLGKSLFLDLCPFFTFALLFTMIFDKTKYASFVISPFCIFASILVIPFVPMTEKGATFSFKYIFIGSDVFRLYYFMHLFLLVFGVLAYKNYSLKGKKLLNVWLDLQLVAIIFFSYVIIMSYALDIDQNTTGISRKDWEKGGSFYAIHKNLKVPHPFEAVIFYLLSYLVINSLLLIKYYINNYSFKEWVKFKLKRNQQLA
ncbi:hypothetical protein D1113_03190 [Mycoplasmopsis gallopavonis]|uniref:Integral membrane protein (Intg_mem_TP0381) n=2 Tax=Mycoplasmopsis gallopavonis TaxID=76629 RepID=A0A449AZW5_9BACT|nr:hypothetical protein D1113_03190 [Mycoplasmopsis gallopavonis]VEU73006.1 Uncharacterised protein [Mycoplasmopsis gallopavonis]